MAQGYDCIGAINPIKDSWSIKIRIVRLWKTPSFANPNEDGSIEMIFLDEKGDKIQASVKKFLVRRFSHLLDEGQCRVISNFGVGENSGSYRPTSHPYKINFFSQLGLKNVKTYLFNYTA
uniref:Fgenesh protein 114 n=1 Tax=Beta vulgaris TaxID=161934 RepID=Q1ZY07_BETVU|nr:Fgenesh protein 114 [Beta vulgaris]